MIKNSSFLIALCIVFSLLLSACSDKADVNPGAANPPIEGVDQEGQQDKEQTTPKSYADDPAKLVIYGAVGNTEEVFNERFGNEIKKKFPNYEIQYIQRNAENTVQNMVTTGQQIDLIHDSAGAYFTNVIEPGFHYDLSGLIKQHNVDMSRIEPNILQSISADNEVYGFPLHDGGLVMYYNKDIFDQFGIPEPTDGMTWDDTISLGRSLTRYEDDKQYVGLGISTTHLLTMNPLSAPFVDPTTGKAAINNDLFRKLVELPISTGQLFNNNHFMKDQTMAMFVMNFYLQLQPDFETFNWDMVSLPVFKDMPGVGTQSYPNALFLTRTSQFKDQAMEVLKFITSDEFQMKLSSQGWVPVVTTQSVKDAFAKETPFADKNLYNALFTNRLAPAHPRTQYDNVVIAALVSQISNIINEGIDLNTALRQAEEEANQKLDEARNR